MSNKVSVPLSIPLSSNEPMGNAVYPLEMFLRMMSVSLETMKDVNGLPDRDI